MPALVKLAVDAAGKPVQEVPFPATIGPSYVYATPAAIRTAVRRFLHPTVVACEAGVADARAPASGPRHGPRPRRGARVAARPVRPALPDPPPLRRGLRQRPRLHPRPGHRAYRLSVRAGLGEYYGIQGTDWTDPPILAAPDEQRRLGNRTFELYYDGRHLRRVALRSAEGSWWVTNTLTLSLTNAQMLAIARSLRTA